MGNKRLSGKNETLKRDMCYSEQFIYKEEGPHVFLIRQVAEQKQGTLVNIKPIMLLR